MSDPETRQKQTHWQSTGGGYVENKNFGVEFRAFIRRRLPPQATRPRSRQPNIPKSGAPAARAASSSFAASIPGMLRGSCAHY